MFGAILQCIGILCESVELYAIGRLVIGAGNGIGLNTNTLYVQECTPTSARGTCACFQVVAQASYNALCAQQEYAILISGLIGRVAWHERCTGHR